MVTVSRTRDVSHPGYKLARYLERHEMTKRALAKKLRVDEVMVGMITLGKRGISFPMAIKLARIFETSQFYWAKLQFTYECSRHYREFKRRCRK